MYEGQKTIYNLKVVSLKVKPFLWKEFTLIKLQLFAPWKSREVFSKADHFSTAGFLGVF